MFKNRLYNLLSDRSTAFWLFVFVFFFNMLFWNGGYVHTSNVHLYLTRSIVEDGDIDIYNNCYRPLKMYRTDIKVHDGKAFSKYPPGRSLLAVPVYAAVYWGINILPFNWFGSFKQDGHVRDWVMKNIATFINFFALALTASILFLTAVHLGYSKQAGLFCGLAYSMSTAMFSFSRSVQAEPVAALCAASAVFFWTEKKEDLKYLIYPYLLLAAGCLLSPQVFTIYFSFLLFHIIERKWKNAFIGAATLLTTGCFILLYNYLRFGNVFDFGYSLTQNTRLLGCITVLSGICMVLIISIQFIKENTAVKLLTLSSLIIFTITASARPFNFFAYFLSLTRGILIYSPVFIMSAFGLWNYYRKDNTEALKLLTIILLYLTFIVYIGLDGSFILTRYAAPIFPIFAIFTAISFDRVRNKIYPYLLALTGFLIQMLISVDNVYNFTLIRRLTSENQSLSKFDRFNFNYSVIKYKIEQLFNFLPDIPDFLLHPQRFERSDFFNNYWFVIYRQELPLWIIVSGILCLATICAASGLVLYKKR